VNTFRRALVGEFRRILRDPGAALILVGAPLIYALFYPIPYRAQVLKHVPIAVVDQDQSDLSRKLTRMVDAHELTRVAEADDSLADAEHAVRAGRAGGVLVIPAQFERRVRRGDQAQVVAYADASYFLIYRQVLTGVLEATGTLSAGIEIRRLQAAGMPIEGAMKARNPLPLVMRPLFNPTEGYAGYVVPAVLVLILQQTLLVGIGVVAGTERERRAAAGRLGVGQAAPAVLGRAAAYLSLYLVHALVYVGIVFRLLGFPQQASAWTIFLFAVPFLLSVVFLGLAVRALFRTREMALQVLLFTSLPALFLAGFAWPIEAIPRSLVVFARALPSTVGISGFLRLTQMGASLPDVREEWLLLWSLCGVYFLFAWVAEWRTDRSRGTRARAGG
jgi:ABC-2 type transport system permease protein